MASRKLLILGLMLACLLSSGLTAPTDTDEYQSDDYDYDEETSTEKNSVEVPNNRNMNKDQKTRLITQNYQLVVKEHDDVTLKCEIEGDNSDVIFMWYNGSAIIQQGDVNLGNDKRVTAHRNNYTLVIRDIQTKDMNEYLCRVYPGAQTVKIDVKVEGPVSSLQIKHMDANVVNQEVFVRAKDTKPLHFQCSANGYPEPTVTWSHNGQRLESNRENGINVNKNGILTFTAVNHNNAGNYQCLADNKIGKPVHGYVTLIVKHEPVFLHHFDYVNTAEGYNADLQCTYSSLPRATEIIWSKVNPRERIRDNEKYSITNEHHNGHNQTKLHIRNVNRQDLTEYVCEVHNEIGRKNERITLGLLPSSAQLHGHRYMLGQLYTNWTVHSVQPLTEFKIQYKKSNTPHSLWQISDAAISEKDNIKTGVWRIRGVFAIEEGDYVFAAKVKNSEGYAHRTIEHPITVTQDTSTLEDYKFVKEDELEDEIEEDDYDRILDLGEIKTAGTSGAGVAQSMTMLPIALILFVSRLGLNY